MMKRSVRYWGNLFAFALTILILLAIGTIIWLAYVRAMTLVHPARSQAVQTPSDYAIVDWEAVNFSSADGLRLTGWFIPPDPSAQGATLILVHGLGSNRSSLLGQAALLHEHGYGALLIDLRNHGESEGAVTTLGYTELEDIQGAIDYLTTRPDVDSNRIGLLGISMGASTVIRAAAHIPTVKAVIAQAAFTSLEDNLVHGIRALLNLPPFPFAPLVVWFGERAAQVDIAQVRPIDEIDDISPRPILIVHGELDKIIPVDNARQLYQAANDPKYIYIVPSAGHGGFLQMDGHNFEQVLVDFLDQYLK